MYWLAAQSFLSLLMIRRIKSRHNRTPVQNKGAEDQARKLMLGSLFWSYLILGLALLVWRFLGRETIQSIYITPYITAVLFITTVFISIGRKNNEESNRGKHPR